ncbi:hypothetical protein, partial [Ruegeria atlantica]|uniref:hypothetical protein n=1 Tax=Ruegeria atlantica TaxID=81569 RepID=UPI001C2C43D9
TYSEPPVAPPAPPVVAPDAQGTPDPDAQGGGNPAPPTQTETQTPPPGNMGNGEEVVQPSAVPFKTVTVQTMANDDGSFTVSGTAEPGSTVTVTFSALNLPSAPRRELIEETYEVTADGDGNYSVTSSTDIPRYRYSGMIDVEVTEPTVTTFQLSFSNTRLVAFIDAEGRVTRQEFDTGISNVVNEVQIFEYGDSRFPGKKTREAEFLYTEPNEVATEPNEVAGSNLTSPPPRPDGGTTQVGNFDEVTDWTYTFDTEGNVATREYRNAYSGIRPPYYFEDIEYETFQYNSNGHETYRTLDIDKDNRIDTEEAFTRDDQGNWVTQETIDYTYDDEGNLTKKAEYFDTADDPETSQETITFYSYDADGKRTEHRVEIDDEGDGDNDSVEHYTYNDQGQDPVLSSAIEYEYNEHGVSREHHDADGNGTSERIITNFYDDDGNIVRALTENFADTPLGTELVVTSRELEFLNTENETFVLTPEYATSVTGLVEIELSASGATTIVLTDEVLGNLAGDDTSYRLRIEGDDNDNVSLPGTQFEASGTEAIDGENYNVYTSSAGNLLIDPEVNVNFSGG